MAKQRPQDDVVRITTVGTSRAQDIATRQRRYLLSMSLRSLCFVGAVIAGLALVWWRRLLGRDLPQAWPQPFANGAALAFALGGVRLMFAR